jgi:hypothetical protein
MKKIQVKMSGWLNVYVDDKLTEEEIIEIVDNCEYISDLLDFEGVNDISDSDDLDFEVCNDDSDPNNYILFNVENDNEINN